MAEVTYRTLSARELTTRIGEFSRLIRDCVAEGASIGFLHPVPSDEADAYWADAVRPGVTSGLVTLWVAEAEGKIVGTVQLASPGKPSHTCRADVLKLMVHPRARRRGIGRRLMLHLLAEAERQKLEILTLDTRVPDTARSLYESLGFIPAGEIPGFVLNPLDTSKRDATLYMYKPLV